MLKVKRRRREFEVGTLKRRGREVLGLVVFDPLNQRSSKPGEFITLFEVAENILGEFRAEVVRLLLGSPDGFAQIEIERAVTAYCLAAGIDPEAEWLEAQRKAAGLRRGVKTYAALKETHAGREVPYEELLATPEWLERRAAILERDGWRCVSCSGVAGEQLGRVVLQVHHRYYVRQWLPWEYPDDALATLCLDCHRGLHDQERVPIFDAILGKLVRVEMRPCIRCLGAGFFPQYLHAEGGVCFRCWGGRFEPIGGTPDPGSKRGNEKSIPPLVTR
jgi:hypothetical protein